MAIAIGIPGDRWLNRLGIIIDVSQLTPAGVPQVPAHSTAPVIASHSDVRALVEDGRNLGDPAITRF